MEEQRLLFVIILIYLAGYSSAKRCDKSTTARVHEGNLGQSGVFNWLGVLSVHLHDEGNFRVAVTGIVLITMKHALASADDVARIPRGVFKSDSKAMFFPTPDTPWYVKPASYVTHPEYEASTLNSIAIIELDLENVNDYQLNPICLPSGDKYNTSRYLYLTGYTDENQKIEKVIYKIQYLEKYVCEEFYNRAGLSSQKRVPSAYVCGYAPSNVTQCVWDNGMALVSNATGYFHLIGFGVHGPGCAAPARFIDLFQYYYWINSIIEPDEIYDDPGFRRKDDDDIPIHELFTTDGARRQSADGHTFIPYPFDTEALKHYIVRPEDDKNNIIIIPFNDTWEQFENACNSTKALMYREYFQLATNRKMTGTITYKLSLFDLHNVVASCVRLTVECTEKSDAIITFREVINFKEGTQLFENSGETPEELIQVFAGATTIEKSKQTDGSVPDPDLFNPTFIKDDRYYANVLNNDLYIKLKFTGRAVMKLEMYAIPGPLAENSSWPNFPTSTPLSNSTTEHTTTMPKVTTKKTSRLRVHKMKAKPVWGEDAWVDKMLREDGAEVVAHVVQEVQESDSAARSAGARGAVVTCWLISAYLRTLLFIN